MSGHRRREEDRDVESKASRRSIIWRSTRSISPRRSIPQKENAKDVWFDEIKPVRVGAVPAEKNDWKLTDVSFRLTSKPIELAPQGTFHHEFQLFAGPKKPAILDQYPAGDTNLGELVYYGWFGFVAKPMLGVLHFFYHLVRNYGLAIVMLTVLVRGCMFPLSRRQAQSSQKMAELKPEIQRVQEKYKDPAQRNKAMQELYRKHNFNPFGGCLLVFVQLPIFVGLYRSLGVDVELRQAPLISDAVRWCSNLAAPDMLWNWTDVVPAFVESYLGPYLNVFPLLTIGLFIWQQKMFMPPPTDEQTAMQQKMMSYMTIFIGFMFYKVASGLCLYFIVSSLWGIAERKALPQSAAGGRGRRIGGWRQTPRARRRRQRRTVGQAAAVGTQVARPRRASRSTPWIGLARTPFASCSTTCVTRSSPWRRLPAGRLGGSCGSSGPRVVSLVATACRRASGPKRPSRPAGRRSTAARCDWLAGHAICRHWSICGRRRAATPAQPAAELHTLGSPPLLAAAVDEFCRHGARPAAPGEFTLRAFLAGRIDLTQAEAVLGVIDAQGEQQLAAALAQLAGGLAGPLARPARVAVGSAGPAGSGTRFLGRRHRIHHRRRNCRRACRGRRPGRADCHPNRLARRVGRRRPRRAGRPAQRRARAACSTPWPAARRSFPISPARRAII